MLQSTPHLIKSYGSKLAGANYLMESEGKIKVGIFSHNNDKINKDLQLYTYFEHLEGKTFEEFILHGNNISENTFLEIWYQIVYALYDLQQKFNFTHYDLHANNILIQSLDEEIILRYNINNTTVSLKTKYLIRFIDYATAYFVIDGKEYASGSSNLHYYMLGRRNTFNPYHDIYLLLMVLLKIFIKTKKITIFYLFYVSF